MANDRAEVEHLPDKELSSRVFVYPRSCPFPIWESRLGLAHFYYAMNVPNAYARIIC